MQDISSEKAIKAVSRAVNADFGSQIFETHMETKQTDHRFAQQLDRNLIPQSYSLFTRIILCLGHCRPVCSPLLNEGLIDCHHLERKIILAFSAEYVEPHCSFERDITPNVSLQ